MDSDEALLRLGSWGRWQVTFYVLICTSQMLPAAWHMLATVFLGGIPEHHCKLPEGASPNGSVPWVKTKEREGYARCSMYENLTVNNETMDCPNGWEYLGETGPTIVSEWDLVCGKDYLVETSQTVLICGVLVGAMLFSVLADTYGRKPVFLACEWALVVIGALTVFVDNYYLYCVLRFCVGALQQGIVLTGFVMACELWPARMRTFAGTAIELFWAAGMCILALFGYLVRHWRYLQLLISLPGMLTIVFYWILPESIPWLVANGKQARAEKILQKAAKMNKVSMPDNVFVSPEQTQLMKDEEDKKENGGFLSKFKLRKKKDSDKDSEEPDAKKYTLLDIFRHPKLRMYAVIMCLLWFVNSLVYFGLSLSTAALAGDPYLNFFLSGFVEIPAYLACIVLLQKWGRRWPLVTFHIIAGVALALTMFIPKKTSDGKDIVWLRTTFSMIGKFGITGSFGTVFLYAPEIFPTTLRGQAMGMSSMGGRLGNMLAPFAGLVARLVPWLPGILFGGLSIGVGLLALLLPETLNRPLPQTIEDIDSWTKKNVPVQPGGVKPEVLEMKNEVKT